MTAPAKFTAAAFKLTAEEMAQLAAEDAHAERIEHAREAAAQDAEWNRHYRDGSWSLDDWLDYTGRSLDSYIPAVAS